MTLAEALIALHKAGKIARPTRPGMRVNSALPQDPPQWDRVEDRDDPNDLYPHEAIDITDAATVGCLLAMLREVLGEPLALPFPYDLHGQIRWAAPGGAYEGLGVGAPGTGETEGRAIASALIALAAEEA